MLCSHPQWMPFCVDCLRQKEEQAKAEERERILKIIDEEASLYSYKEEMVRPSIVAAIFVNAVKVKVARKDAVESIT